MACPYLEKVEKQINGFFGPKKQTEGYSCKLYSRKFPNKFIEHRFKDKYCAFNDNLNYKNCECHPKQK